MVEWKGKEHLTSSCRNGLTEMDFLRANGKNRVSGGPNRVNLYADMMRLLDPDSPVSIGEIRLTDVYTRLYIARAHAEVLPRFGIIRTH